MFKRFIFSSIVLCGVFSAVVVHAQVATASQPNIQTYNTATSSTIIITAPAGYKSEVISTYNGNQFDTFATSTPLTATDEENIQNEINTQEAAVQQIFLEEQAIFQQQEQLFQNMWSNF